MDNNEPKYWGTDKGLVLEVMANFLWVENSPIDLFGLVQMTYLSENELMKILDELIRDGDVHIEDDKWYNILPELAKEYIDYIDYEIERAIKEEEMGVIQVPFVEKRDIIVWTDGWIKIHKPEISLEKEHFFLEGYYLDVFIKFLISKANETIIVINPFLDMITPIKLLIEAKQDNKRVVMVTRPPDISSTRKYHKSLLDSGITILYHENLHAKILIFDDKIAIVSSMNFLQRATAGISWEAGIVTINVNTVNMIKDSITNLQLESANI